MSKNRIGLLIISIAILLVDVAMVFVLNAFSKSNVVLYVVSKCIAIAAFVGVTVFGLSKKKEVAHYYLQYVITISFQFVPLVIRYIPMTDNGQIITFIVFFVSVLVYLGLEIGLIILNHKAFLATEHLKGKEIPIKEE